MPPPLTAEQRAAATARAAQARAVRAGVRARLKQGEATLGAVIAAGQSDDGDGAFIGRMRVAVLLASLPGVGPARAHQAMAQVGIAPTRRVRGLGAHQVAALGDRFGP